MDRKRDIRRLAHLLRVTASTVTILAGDCAALEATRLANLAREVEIVADELDDIGDTVDETSPGRSRQTQ